VEKESILEGKIDSLMRRLEKMEIEKKEAQDLKAAEARSTSKIYIVDYFASRRLVVDYFAYAARPGASTRRAARHPARRRLLHLRHASGCFGTSCGLSRDSSSTTSPRAGSSSTTSPTSRVRVPRHVARLVTWLVVDYFTYVAHSVAPARRAAFRVTHRRLLRLAQARC
jgi:hypothetical protein